MEVKELKFADGAGGLNNRDHPSRIALNEFSALENILTDEGGWPGKKRLGQLLMQYAPIDPEPSQGVLTITALPDGPGPGNIRVQCATTASIKLGMKLTFYDAVPAVVEANVVVTQIVDGTTFRVVNTVPFAVGNSFKQSGTLHLWHMDTAAGAVPDDTIFEVGSPYAAQSEAPFGGDPASVAGLFPVATPLARLGAPAPDSVFFPADGSGFRSTYTDLINALTTVFFEAWVYINPSFTGKPVIVTNAFGSGQNASFTNSGGHILATRPQAGFGGPLNLGQARNGLSLFRDWDATNNVDAGDPYITFTLWTTGSGQQVLTSKFLPTGSWLFVRGSYIQSTGKVRLRINGEIHAEAFATGTVDDDAGSGVPGYVHIGGTDRAILVPAFAAVATGLDARIEEARIRTEVTTAEEEAQPFKEQRGKPWPLNKADGTKQLIIGAGDGLYYTVGDSAWVKMNDAVHDVLGAELFSSTAFWDAIQVGDLLFLQNGIDGPKVWDGLKLWPWGNGVQMLTLTPVVAVGQGTTGLVDYYYTYIVNGKETGPSVLSQVTFAAVTEEADITNIPLGAPGTSARKIYRVKKTGPNAGKIYLVRQINDNVTTSLTGAFNGAPADPNADTGRDGLPDATLGTGNYVEMTAEVRFSLIPKGKYLLAAHNRGWIAGVTDDQYAAFFTELNAMHTSLAASFVRATSDSGPLIGMAKYYGEIHASKDGNATLVLRGDNPSNWTQWEILHPTIGAIDHWSYVHRTIPQSDSYRLCFWAKDGAYAYAGQDFEKISDLIDGTVQTLAVNSGNKQAVTVTTRTDWESAISNNGSASANVYSPTYETDGFREVLGQARIVNQLDYLALWKGTSPLVTGKVSAVAKGPAEGEFYFGTQGFAQTIYRTTDNFVTPPLALSVGAVGEFPVAIVYASILGVDNLFVFMANTSSVGAIYRIQNPAGVPVVSTLASGLNFKVSKGVTPTGVDVLDGLVAFGGNFSPQPVWDGANSRLWFVSSDLVGPSFRARAKLVDLTATVTTVLGGFQGSTDRGYVSIATDGTFMFFNYFDSVTGKSMLAKAHLATLAVTDISPFNPAAVNSGMVVRRISYNTSTARIVAVGAKIVTLASTRGFIAFLDPANGNLTELKLFNATGAYPREITFQNVSPFAHYVAMQALTATEPVPIYKVAKEILATTDVSEYKAMAYTGVGATAATNGIISNLLFVPASGSGGGLLWSDRLYWYADAATASDARMLQLGVPGNWTVQADYISQAFVTGGFTAFDSFGADFQGDISFFLRNAATVPGLAASEQGVSPNAAVNVFPTPSAIFQFRLRFVWNGALTTASPYIDVAEISYFSGVPNVPRVVGWQWKGRTYWAVAEVGQTRNNLVVVYQKNNRWTIYKNWRIKGTAEFLGKLVANQDFALVQLEVDNRDLGNLIRTRARTGYIMEDMSDKCIRDANFNVLSYVNSKFPTKSGWMKMVPYGANTRLAADWVFEIPATPTPEPRQVLANFTQASFPYQYARALALEVLTSDETGLLAPVVDQVENIASLMVRLFVSPPRYQIVRP